MNRGLLLVAILQAGVDVVPMPQAGLADLRGEALVGRVRDAAGAPVADASVRVTATANRNFPVEGEFIQAGLHQLRWTALPVGRSDARGEFRIPLHDDLRRLGVAGGLRLALVVDKAGYRPWLGPIGTCPGRMGAMEVRLAPEAPGAIPGRVLPPPGFTGSLAGRLGVTYDYHNVHGELDARSFGGGTAVADDGSFALPRHGLDGPELPVPSPGQNIKTLGFHLRPVIVGIEGDVHWFPQDAAMLQFQAQPRQEPGVTIPLRCEGGPPPAVVEAFFRPQYGTPWRTEQAFGPLQSRGISTPHGVAAPGWMGTWLPPGAQQAVLRPLPSGPVELELRGAGNEPLPDAEVELIALAAAWLATGELPLGLPAARGDFLRLRSNHAGRIVVPPEHCVAPHVLVARAVGYVPRAVDLADAITAGHVALTPADTGTLQLRVLGPDGAPSGRATVLLSDSAYRHQLACLAGPPPRTDAQGQCRLQLSRGAHQVLVFQDGCAFGQAQFELGEQLALEIQLTKAAAGVVEVVGSDRQPVPWLLVRGTHASAITDAHGRVRLDGQSAAQATPLGFANNGLSVETPAMLDPGSDITRLRCTSSVPTPLRVRTAPGLGSVAIRLRTAREETASEPTAFGAADFLFLLGSPGPAQLQIKAGPIAVRQECVLQAGRTTELDLRPDAWPEVALALAAPQGELPPAGLHAVLQGAADPVDLAASWRKAGDGPDRLRLRAPARGEVTYVLQHPRLLPTVVRILDGKPQDVDGRVVLVPGAPLTLRVTWPEGTPPGALACRATLVRGQERTTLQVRPRPVPGADTGPQCEVAWPTALPPGDLSCALALDQIQPATLRSERQQFAVRGTEPILVTLTLQR